MPGKIKLVRNSLEWDDVLFCVKLIAHRFIRNNTIQNVFISLSVIGSIAARATPECAAIELHFLGKQSVPQRSGEGREGHVSCVHVEPRESGSGLIFQCQKATLT